MPPFRELTANSNREAPWRESALERSGRRSNRHTIGRDSGRDNRTPLRCGAQDAREPPGSERSRCSRNIRCSRTFVSSPICAPQAGRVDAFTSKRPNWLTSWARRQRRPRPPVVRAPFAKSEIQRRSWRSLTSGPHALILSYIQHHAVRNGVEMRFPFFDPEVVGAALSIPSMYWPPPWPYERLHRDILKPWLPQAVVQRRSKADFRPAVLGRVRRHLSAIQEVLFGREWKSEKYVDQLAARQMFLSWLTDEKPDFSTTYAIWGICTLEAWLRRLCGYNTGPTAR